MIAFICTMVEDTDDQSFMIDLYHSYKKLMLLTARKYIADGVACEDIVQDSIVKLIQHISVIRTKERCVLGSYIVSTVRNCSIDYLREQGRAEKYFAGAEVDDEFIEDSEMLGHMSETLEIEKMVELTAKNNGTSIDGELDIPDGSAYEYAVSMKKDNGYLLELYFTPNMDDGNYYLVACCYDPTDEVLKESCHTSVFSFKLI